MLGGVGDGCQSEARPTRIAPPAAAAIKPRRSVELAIIDLPLVDLPLGRMNDQRLGIQDSGKTFTAQRWNGISSTSSKFQEKCETVFRPENDEPFRPQP
ncbi:hypothetical protein [Mesorhizobium sp. M0199]|uniref:hypothetical protein n=1 Tax=unclassified Mesorhizobium TaxID=325217 RepID=UPI003337A4B1